MVQATGLGGTSLNAVVEDLISLGVTTFVRIGSCRAADGVEAGDVVIVRDAIPLDAAAVELSGSNDPLSADPELTAILEHELPDAKAGTVRSTSLGHVEPKTAPRVLASDLATAALFATVANHGAHVRAAAALVARSDANRRLDDSQLDAKFRDLAPAAAAALTDS
jgi:uridine phosphorylase